MIGVVQNQKLNYLFRLLDIDKNGIIEYDDFAQYVTNFSKIYNLKPDSEQYLELKKNAETWWNTLQSAVDRDGDAELTLEEWMNFHERNALDMAIYDDTHFLYMFVINVFRLIDENGDGKTGKKEYANFLKAWDIETNVNAIFKVLDIDGDGILTRTDYINLLYEFYTSDTAGVPGNYLFGPYSPLDPICKSKGTIAMFLDKIFN